ncbi:MAG: hypothetical protein H0U63_01225 [Burkholderiales bacterium]|nr:hypothetical protein [Burkholderiales bacterium]
MPAGQHRFRVELLVNTPAQPSDTILVKEVIAAGEKDAADLAIRLLMKENPTTTWIKIAFWYAEEIH